MTVPRLSTDPTLSVVLITHNGSRTIGDQLAAVAAQEWDEPWEFVVVDNVSDDSTPELLAEFVHHHPAVRVVSAGGRAGAGYARNQGIDAARGRYVAFVDDDDRVGDGWLRAIGTAVMRHDYVGARLEVQVLSSPRALRSRSPAQQYAVDEFCGVPVCAAPLMAVRRDWLLGVGGCDEDMWPEDTDLALRLFDAHRRGPVFCADAVYHYRLRDDPTAVYRQAYRYGLVRPWLLRQWRHLLDPPPRRGREAGVEWARLVASAPRVLVRPDRRLGWLRRLGSRVGHLVGTVRFRVWWP